MMLTVRAGVMLAQAVRLRTWLSPSGVTSRMML
jgi:hypothetical protein